MPATHFVNKRKFNFLTGFVPRSSGLNGHRPDFPVLSPTESQYMDPAQWTVVDQTRDHPGRRKNSGFLQPIKHLSGKK
jgi:hypothetical protein